MMVQIHPATSSSSAIDLSIASPSLYLDFFWEVVTDLHGSDHFPICIQSLLDILQHRGIGLCPAGATPLWALRWVGAQRDE